MFFEYQTDRLILKVIKPDEAAQVLDFYLRDKELFEKYEPDRIQDFYTVEKQKQIAAYEYNAAVKGTCVRFYVYRKENPGQIIGTICFHDIQRGVFSCCEIGYKFSSAFQHRGYALEALNKVTDLIFTEVGLHRIMAWALPDNAPSAKLLRRAGFCYEGISHDHLFLQGQWRDHAQYSLIRSMMKNYVPG